MPVKVIPRAGKNEIVGWLGDALKVRIAAAPTDGRANDALETFLAGEIGLKRNQVRIVAGRGSQRKVVEIHGMDRAELERRLGKA